MNYLSRNRLSSDLETESSAQEKRSYSAVITASEIGRLQKLAIPSAGTDDESGKWAKKIVCKHVIKGTALGSQIRGVRMTCCKLCLFIDSMIL